MGVSSGQNPSPQFSLRLAEDGKITFVEQRAAALLAVPTEQILGRYWWQIMHPADEQTVRDTFLHILQDQGTQISARLRARGGCLPCMVTAHRFLNPYSEQFEYVVATHMILSNGEGNWQCGTQQFPTTTPSEFDPSSNVQWCAPTGARLDGPTRSNMWNAGQWEQYGQR
ncbi:unnamed protein product [Gongylonema pulchrum]|uniref:PAS domain-containing protein n=1 Tax=Gongylonema pulchrum TaxID=637853 RepID=A0A183ENJ1_9BILA|nr:unnamed protein product [Gongylonema pulchrum]